MSETVIGDDGQGHSAGAEGAAETDPLQAALQTELDEERDTLQLGEERVLPYGQTGVLVVGGRRFVITGNSETVTLTGRDAEGNQYSVDVERRQRLDLGVAYDSPRDEALGIDAHRIVGVRRGDNGVVVQCDAPGAMLLALGEAAPAEEQALEPAAPDEDPYNSTEPEAAATATPEAAPDADDIFSSPQRLLEVLHDESVDSETRKAIMHCLGAWGQIENGRMTQELWQQLEQDGLKETIGRIEELHQGATTIFDDTRQFVERLNFVANDLENSHVAENDRERAFDAAAATGSELVEGLRKGTYGTTLARLREELDAWCDDERRQQISRVEVGVSIEDPEVVGELIKYRQPGESLLDLASRLTDEAKAGQMTTYEQRNIFGLLTRLKANGVKTEEQIAESVNNIVIEELVSLRTAPDRYAAAGTIATLVVDIQNRIGSSLNDTLELAQRTAGQKQRQNQS